MRSKPRCEKRKVADDELDSMRHAVDLCVVTRHGNLQRVNVNCNDHSIRIIHSGLYCVASASNKGINKERGKSTRRQELSRSFCNNFRSCRVPSSASIQGHACVESREQCMPAIKILLELWREMEGGQLLSV